MYRMREHVVKQMDKNGDRLISLQEFLQVFIYINVNDLIKDFYTIEKYFRMLRHKHQKVQKMKAGRIWETRKFTQKKNWRYTRKNMQQSKV